MKPLYTVLDSEFAPYGRVLSLDTAALVSALQQAPAPADDVLYVPSDAGLEALETANILKNSGFGGLPIQLGYCNGTNESLNAVEYHRCSEINVAATDLILLLGLQTKIHDGSTYSSQDIEAFLVPKGCAIEVYATTLHYAPCCAKEGEPFRCAVVLPRGTNAPLDRQPEALPEDRLLFAQNKWLIAHPDSGLETQGACIGITGKNVSVRDFEPRR